MSSKPRYLLVALVLGACSSDTDSTPAEETVEEHVCEHIAESGTAIAASAVRDSSAPVIEVGENTYLVSLNADSPVYVRITNTADTAYLLAASEDNVVGDLYFGDEATATTSAGALAECSSNVAAHYDLDLEEIGDYYLALGPSATSSVKLVLASGAEHGH